MGSSVALNTSTQSLHELGKIGCVSKIQ